MEDGPSDRIRTCGILLPKQARYQLRYTRLLSFLSGWSYSPKAGALPTALHPDIFDFLLCQPCEFRYNNPLRFPQKHSRTARLERVALLVVFSPQSFA